MTKPTHNRLRRTVRAMAAGLLVGTALVSVDAAAQQQLRLQRSNVDVDWSVIDELDTRPAAAPRLGASSSARNARRAPTTTSRAATASAAARPSLAPRAAAASAVSSPAGSFASPTPPPSFSDSPPPSRTASPLSPTGPTPLTPPPAPPAVATLSAPAPAPMAQAPAPMASAPPPAPIAPPAPMSAPTFATPTPSPMATSAPAPMAAPTPTAAPAPAPAAPQMAALPPASQSVDGPFGRIDFAVNAAELPSTANSILDRAASDMKRDDNIRLQIVAYATGGDESGSQARRLSLSRALAVRSYLIDQGIRSTRMDVRALGSRAPEGPSDRVDIVIVRR